MRAKFCAVIGFCFLLIFAGCGSSNSNPTPEVPATLTGYYTGTLQSADQSTSYAFEGVILSNQQMYGMYGTRSDSGYLTIKGMVTGTVASSYGTWVVNSLTEYGSDAKNTTRRTLSGTYDASSIKASITTFNGNMQLNAAAVPNFNVTQAASVPVLDGAWDGANFWGDARLFGAPFYVSNGQFDDGYYSWVNGEITQDCVYTARLAAQSQNYFAVSTSVNTGARGPCPEAGQTAQGIAITALMANGKQHLVMFATTSANQAEVFVGDKN